jgi:hypothetical protein
LSLSMTEMGWGMMEVMGWAAVYTLYVEAKTLEIPLNPPSKGGLRVRFPPFEGGLGGI